MEAAFTDLMKNIEQTTAELLQHEVDAIMAKSNGDVDGYANLEELMTKKKACRTITCYKRKVR